jgi:hypothetical protein
MVAAVASDAGFLSLRWAARSQPHVAHSDGFAMHPHTLTLLVMVTLVLAGLVGLLLSFIGLRLL